MKQLLIVLFTGHVGSSWFMSLLGNHPDIEQIGFEPVDEMSKHGINASPVFDKLLNTGCLDGFPPKEQMLLGRKHQKSNKIDFNGEKKIYAIKARPRIELQKEFFFEFVEKARPKVILLRRNNKIKNAVSQYKRTALNISHLTDFQKNEQKRAPVEVDVKEIIERSRDFVRREIAAKYLLSFYKSRYDIDTLELFYEELIQGPDHRELTCNNCFDFVGVPHHDVQSDYKKMTPDNLENAVKNFNELAEQIKSSEFAPILDDPHYDIVSDVYENAREQSRLWPANKIVMIDNLIAASRQQ